MLADDALNSDRHWAYTAPLRPTLPSVKQGAWLRNPLDAFVLARLEKAGFAPSPPASREKLARRVFFDLLGLPPTPEQVDAFVEDTRPRAYERLVDGILASPAYGERWARQWLDLARYADSNGFQRDGHRSVWPYRDWVVGAFNADLPFNRFTVEQIAGDLLPGATLEQRIATGFHRGATVNTEAGTDQEENRVNAVFDRVATTGIVWLGTTLECAQCHDHKYDPISQKEYYQLFAYFNNTKQETKQTQNAGRQFVGPWVDLPVTPERQAKIEELESRITSADEKLARLKEKELEAFPQWERNLRSDPALVASLPAKLRAILARPDADRTEDDTGRLRAEFLNRQSVVRQAQKRLNRQKKELKGLKPATTLVMEELPEPRATHVLGRGVFLEKEERVTPGAPGVLHAMRADAPANRMGLAQWLVDPGNPLVARVTVNRWWIEMFGRGLVESAEDFGTQGQPPTHPRLLDWLAVEFMESGWSMKTIHRLLVTSATYRQASKVSAEQLRRDPRNTLYSRGPRFRLSAEAVRDNGLAASGLLQTKIGGPPVYPVQPDRTWTVTGNVDNRYPTSSGPDRFRRSLYTVWRRSSPYPSLVNFDAPDRASSCVRRSRTNTPLQALTLLNDPVYVEMAMALGQRLLMERPSLDLESRLEYGFRLCVTRKPRGEEVETLKALYLSELKRFEKNPDAALALTSKLADPDSSTTEDCAQRAAWFSVASVLLNLDETITKS